MAYVPRRNEIEELLASYGEGPLGYDEGGSSIRPADIQAEWLAAETAITSGIDPNLGSYGAPVPVHRTSATAFLAPEFDSGATNLSEGDIEHRLLERGFPSTVGQVPEGYFNPRASFRDPTLGTNVSGTDVSALPTALPSNLEALYEQLYGGMRSDAEAAWQRSTMGNAELDSFRDAYLETLGGGPNLAYWDNRLSRTLAYLDQTEQSLLAGIDEMEALKRAGIEGAAERQMEMYAELEQVRGERLRVDEEQALLRLSEMEAERVATEQMWHQSISEGGAQRQAEHAQRQAEAAARLEGMGIDPSTMTTDETAALLEMQAERGDLFSGRIEAAGAGRAGYQELALQDMFGAANRSLEDQLFAGRAATGETEAMSLQALAEAVLGMQQNVASTAAEGRFVASEEAEAGKFAERGSAAQRASEAAAARLGFAESDAAREFAADEAYYGALSQIDQAELMSEIGLEESRIAGIGEGATWDRVSNYAGLIQANEASGWNYPDLAVEAAVGIYEETGNSAVLTNILDRQQDMADESFELAQYDALGPLLQGVISDRLGVPVTAEQAGTLLRLEALTGFDNQQGVTLAELEASGASPEEFANWISGDGMVFTKMAQREGLLEELFAWAIRSAEG